MEQQMNRELIDNTNIMQETFERFNLKVDKYAFYFPPGKTVL